jgi:DNA-binding transcriptional LysR family regulator
MDLDVGQVRAFVAVVDELNFGRAAERLYLTQQALSKRVMRLEQTLGVRLLDRGHHAVRLTDAGNGFLPHGRRLLAVADAGWAAASAGERPPCPGGLSAPC